MSEKYTAVLNIPTPALYNHFPLEPLKRNTILYQHTRYDDIFIVTKNNCIGKSNKSNQITPN